MDCRSRQACRLDGRPVQKVEGITFRRQSSTAPAIRLLASHSRRSGCREPKEAEGGDEEGATAVGRDGHRLFDDVVCAQQN